MWHPHGRTRESRLDAAPPCGAKRLGRSWQDGHLRVTGQTLAQQGVGGRNDDWMEVSVQWLVCEARVGWETEGERGAFPRRCQVNKYWSDSFKGDDPFVPRYKEI